MRIISLCVAAATIALAISGSAQGALVTVGSPLPPTDVEVSFRSAGTFINTTLGEPGANVVSPISGAVVGFKIAGAEGGTYALRILRQVEGRVYTAVASSPPMAFGAKPVPFQPLRIQAGDTIGLDMSANAKISLGVSTAGSSYADWIPPLATGATLGYTAFKTGRELEFNADVQPPPTISSITPRSGSFKGLTKVQIRGNDLLGVSAVEFGTRRALGVRSRSEHLLTVLAPAAQAPGATHVHITTAAGTTRPTGSSRFEFTACVVPRLKSRSLGSATLKLHVADCRVGEVRRGGTRVVRQSPKAGRRLAPGAEVNLVLG